MKKIYSILAAATIAVSASAAIPQASSLAYCLSQMELEAPILSPVQSKNRIECKQAESAMQITSMKRIARKAEGEGSKYDGTYTMTVGDWYNGANSKGSVDIAVEISVEDGEIEIGEIGEQFFPIPVVAAINEETGDITFSAQEIADLGGVQVNFAPFCWDGTANAVVYKSYTATYNEETASFEFPAEHGFSWPCWEQLEGSDSEQYLADAAAYDQSAETFGGYFRIFDVEGLVAGEPVEEWQSMGEGTYVDAMFFTFGEGEPLSWQVEIEENTETSGIYRLSPYAKKNPVGDKLVNGATNSVELIINATDPNQVYIQGEFTIYGIKFRAMNTYGGMNGNTFGTLKDGIITFPDKAFAYYNSGWYYVSSSGSPNMQISLPGTKMPDYSVSVTTPKSVSADNTWTLNFTAGEDVAYIKYLVLPKSVNSQTYKNEFAEYGHLVVNNTATVSPITDNDLEEPITTNRYAAVQAAAFSADGTIQNIVQLELPVIFNDTEAGWKTVGVTSFTDCFYVNQGLTFTNDQVTVQAATDNSANYRLVTPYAPLAASGLFDLGGRTVSLVINAEDPEYVKVPAFFSGLDWGKGSSAAGNAFALGYTKTLAAQYGVAATTIEDNVISFPAKVTFCHVPYGQEYSSWYYGSNEPSTITLPAISVDVTVVDQKGQAAAGVAISLTAPETPDTPEAQSDEEGEEPAAGGIVTNSDGKATIEIPFSVGYFGQTSIYVANKEYPITLDGAKNTLEAVVEVTGIQEVAPAAERVIIDMQGRRVNNATRGLYIINGQKTLVK